MEQVESDDEALLSAWQQGRAERSDLYAAVRLTMYQGARQGIGSITSSDPDSQDVEDVVYDAFLELERKGPAGVSSLFGLARKIAYRRGQDAGRKIICAREQMGAMVATLRLTADQQFHEDDVRAAAEQEVLAGLAMVCMEALTEAQRDVVQATVMGRESLSDWALRIGKAHQVASRQRARALRLLRRCVEAKSHSTAEGVDDDRQ